jgi:hypothetical protein
MRVRPYETIHKALRARLFDLGVELGRADFANPSDRRLAIDAWRQAAAWLREHHGHEEQFMEPMLRPHARDVVAANEAQHAAVDRAMVELDQIAGELEQVADRGHALAQRYQAFLVEYLGHMRHEETAMTAALHAQFSDQELIELSVRVQASIPPARFCALLGLILPAINLDERAAMLGGIARHAPAPAFAAIAEVAARVLGTSGWQAVRARAGIAS